MQLREHELQPGVGDRLLKLPYDSVHTSFRSRFPPQTTVASLRELSDSLIAALCSDVVSTHCLKLRASCEGNDKCGYLPRTRCQRFRSYLELQIAVAAAHLNHASAISASTSSMDYPFENLLDERFQQLCQTLLVKEFPGVNFLPVGQPDGGRDALLYEDASDNFSVFQVKFSRKPLAGREAREWVLSAARDEVDKIKKLVDLGATRYFFICNVPGTSHLDTGSIDRLQAFFKEHIPIKVDCWWRDDLCRRIEANWDIKLSYPALLTGQDYAHLLNGRFDSQDERLSRALRGFLIDQYRDDCEVRFKVADLQHNLLDLFVDLPFHIEIPNTVEYRLTSGRQNTLKVFGSCLSQGSERKTTSVFLLEDSNDECIQQTVVEGAPGQGKSTLAQFICQVHRIRILQKEHDLAKLPEFHRNCPLRLPFRIDLRDLAVWLDGFDPFETGKDKLKPHDNTKALSTFLVHLVRHCSDGFDFDLHDLARVAKTVPLLLVLDGLDEVVDIQQRQNVIAQVSKAIPKLRAECPGLRVVVTSRPAAFANSPGFDRDRFSYLTLGDVGPTQIQKYADVWMGVRNLTPKERREFQSVLIKRIEQPHMRDLARNPMQLTILLNLIHKKGLALPDKRTSLYDNYLEILLDRESEKSDSVRKHRTLIRNIHAYIAWQLHLRGEIPSKCGAGRLTEQELIDIITKYLKIEEYDFCSNEILEAVRDRVRLIVSRVEGAYEFAVQPLREYFAARFLYFTASYSPQGNKKPGTKSDRFKAISRDAYWRNVVRFYCGFYSEGELLALADHTKDLIEDPAFGKTSYPVRLAAMFLADWVFDQSPKATKLLLSSLTTRASLYKLAPDFLWSRNALVEVPKECGGVRLSNAAYEYLDEETLCPDFSSRLAIFVKLNSDEGELQRRWMNSPTNKKADKVKWLRVGSLLNLIQEAPKAVIVERIGSDICSPDILNALYTGSRYDCALLEPSNHQAVFLSVFTQSVEFGYHAGLEGGLYLLPSFLGRMSLDRFPGSPLPPLRYELKRFQEKFGSLDAPVSSPLSLQAFEFSRKLQAIFDFETRGVSYGNAFETAIEECRAIWGDQPAIISLTCTLQRAPVAGRKRPKELNLLAENASLLSRVKFAKKNCKNTAWWREQLSLVDNEGHNLLLQFAFWSFAYRTVIGELLDDIDRLLRDLDGLHWSYILNFVPRTVSSSEKTPEELHQVLLSGRLCERTALLLALRYPSLSLLVFQQYFKDAPDRHPQVLSFRQKYSFESALRGDINWVSALEVIRETYSHGACSEHFEIYPIRRRAVPLSIAEEVLETPDLYPSEFWWSCEKLVSNDTRKTIKRVSQIAKNEHWFSDRTV